jgi:hypothetical protein
MLPVFKEKFTRLPANPSPAFPDRTHHYWPFVRIRIINKDNKDKYIDFRALLDTGAGLNIFQGEFGRQIGLNIVNDKIEKIEGIGGHTFDGYVHDIILEVGGWKFNTHACFTFSDIVCPVLGREGFLNLFEIKINYSKKEMEFRAKARPI